MQEDAVHNSWHQRLIPELAGYELGALDVVAVVVVMVVPAATEIVSDVIQSHKGAGEGDGGGGDGNEDAR